MGLAAPNGRQPNGRQPFCHSGRDSDFAPLCERGTDRGSKGRGVGGGGEVIVAATPLRASEVASEAHMSVERDAPPLARDALARMRASEVASEARVFRHLELASEVTEMLLDLHVMLLRCSTCVRERERERGSTLNREA